MTTPLIASISSLGIATGLTTVVGGAVTSIAAAIFHNLEESGVLAHGRTKQLTLVTTVVLSVITASVLVCFLPISLALLLTLPTLILGLSITFLIERERTYLFAERNINNNNHFSLLRKDIKGSWKYFFADPYLDDEKSIGFLRQAPMIFVEEMIYPEKGLSRLNYGRTNEMLNFHKIFNKASAIAIIVFSQYATNSESFSEERVRIDQNTINVGWWILDEQYKTYSSKPYEVIHIGEDQKELSDTQKSSLKKILGFASHPLFFI